MQVVIGAIRNDPIARSSASAANDQATSGIAAVKSTTCYLRKARYRSKRRFTLGVSRVRLNASPTWRMASAWVG